MCASTPVPGISAESLSVRHPCTSFCPQAFYKDLESGVKVPGIRARDLETSGIPGTSTIALLTGARYLETDNWNSISLFTAPVSGASNPGTVHASKSSAWETGTIAQVLKLAFRLMGSLLASMPNPSGVFPPWVLVVRDITRKSFVA